MVTLQESKKYLDPKVISRISNYRLLAKFIIDGFFMGIHRGPRHAFSLEYSKHRDYYPGDPLKLVDWKLYGKSDRFFVKQYEEETNLAAWLVLDVSKSMSFQSKQTQITKLKYATYLAAAMSYMLYEQRDLTGLILFDDQLRKLINPSSTRGQFHIILRELANIQEGKESHFEDAAKLAASRIKKRGMILLFSDLLASPEKIEKTLKHYMHKGNELVVFHILTHEELQFPFKKFGYFQDLETDEKILLQPKFLKQEYVEQMQQYLDVVKKSCGKLRVSYQVMDTTTPFDRALMTFLTTRARMM